MDGKPVNIDKSINNDCDEKYVNRDDNGNIGKPGSTDDKSVNDGSVNSKIDKSVVVDP